MKLKKGITLIISAVVGIAVLLGTLSLSRNLKNTREFVADGFILKPSAEEVVTTDVDEQYYFGQGTKYKEKYATKILFKDKTGQDVAIDVNQYLHYADGSLGSFTKGVIMSLADITDEQFGYYSLTKNTILIKNNNSYEMSSRGEKMDLSEFIWKISDTDYMIVSPEVTLHLNDSSDITLPEYAQIKYVDNGIVRIVHQQGTYQTVSADTFLRTQGGAELNLVGKNFYINGEPALSLDSMSIDDDSYIDIDENVDTPELKIPTFNVINGKDGTSGADGKAGENGEEGVVGEDGAEGEEGVAGAEGQQGAEGANGTNGVEGDTGVMGYDGAEGKKGKDAENAGQTGGVTAADLLARPTVTLNSATGYDVTASTADMQLKMDISSGSLVDGSTSVTVYERATMKPISFAGASDLSNLESGAVLDYKANNLNPDTEYVLIVAGQYTPEAGGDAIAGNLFTKIFKTDSLGILISKKTVTEKSVSVATKVTATNIGSYDVIFFKEYDNNGDPVPLAKYTQDISKDELVMNDTEPSGSQRTGTFSMESNTTYYACIANVKDKMSQLINTGDTTIELKTLKRKPYKDGDENTTISAMKPVLTQNIRSHSLIVSMDNVVDPDNGVTGYRYELYKQIDVTNAIQDGTYANLKPTFTKESTILENQTFNLETTDKNGYCAKIVALFNDNEKDVEYGTLFSEQSKFDEDGGRFTVEFVDIDKGYTDSLNHGAFDKISGIIRIKDPDNVLLGNINKGTSPLLLTIAGDDISTYSQDLDLTVSGVRNDGDYTLIPFVKNGLRANTTYTLTVSGPIDSDKDGSLNDVEKLTYLSGIQGVTLDTKPLSLVSYEVNVPSVAFARAFNLTSPVLTGAADEPVSEYYQYETAVLSNIQFKLIHIDDNGIERQIGNIATITEKKDTNVDYNFDTSAWIERNNNVVTQVKGGLAVSSANANQNAEAAGFVLTPNSFGLDNSDSIFFGGGQFKIQVTSATDYTTKNIVPFTSGEDVIVFEVVAKHVSATDPNTQIEADLVLNDGAISTFEDLNVSEDTAVGIRFRAEYPYSDIKKLTYYIYELGSSDPSTATLDGVTAGPGQPGTPSALINLNSATPGANPAYGTLVLKGCKNTGGSSGGTSSTPVELYFKNTKSHVNSGANYIWTLPDGTSADDKDVLKRGKRYFIRYEVEADASVIDCKGDHIDDIYPFCAYDDGVTVPCYRSSVLEIEKQMPKVERYPSDSGANSATWKYRIDDPDQAIVQDSNGNANFTIKQYTSAENAISGTGASNPTQTIDLNVFTADEFNPISFNLTSGKYFTVTIPYQLSTVKAEEELVSIPVPFNALTTSAPTGIRCQGVLANANTPVGNTVTISGKSYEKALINESGYRYRLNFRGADIPKYAAVRVTIEGNGKSVVYDPVYFQYTGTTSSGDGSEPYAYAYLDAAPLSEFTQNTTAQVKVTGYYSTNQSGVDTYESQIDNYTTTKDFTGENVFAIKSLKSDGTVNYKKISGGNWTSTPTGLVGSLFVPGLSNGSGFTSPVLTNGSYVGSLTQRYPAMPIVVDTSSMGDQSKISIDLLFDQNGMKDTSSNYYMVEKLGVSGSITFADESKSIQIADILPAVEENSFTIGARSARLKFNALGTGATPTSAVYAEVYKVENGISELCDVTSKTSTDPVSGDPISYYEVGNVNPSADYSNDTFKNNKITIQTEGTNILADLRLRNLDLGTTYQVKMFSYNSTGDKTYLYCRDKNIIGYAYEFKTKEGVDIIINAPSYNYINYLTKNAYVAFGISGDDEGTDMDINWKLYNSKDIEHLGTQILTGTAVKQSNGSYEYYAQNPADNTAISLDMSPGGPFHLNSGYTIELTAKSVQDNEYLGIKTLSFDTPSTLTTPSFLVQTTQSTGKITARVVSTDIQRSIKDDSFTLSLYDEDGVLVGSDNENIKTIKRSNDNQHTATVEFTEGFTSGGEYTLKLVAGVDLDNNGVEDSDKITNEYVVTVSSRTQATLGGSANPTELTLNFDNVQGFGDVRKIKITAFDSTNTLAFNGEITSGDSFVADGETGFIKTIDWTKGSTKTSGWYKVQVQYRDASGNPLGNDEIQIQCEE